MGKTIVIALGGNAILRDDQKGTAKEQYANLERACRHLVPLVREGHKLILTHGNGPQVGNLLLQQEEAHEFAPAMPLDICVAMTQGGIGTLLERALANALRAAGIQREVLTFVSHFLVDPDDADFRALSKPIGPFLSEALKQRYDGLPDHHFRKVGTHPERPYRRVVASPQPLRLLEKRALKALSEAGVIVVAAGGGGIPVVLEEDSAYRSIEAVIDKDLAGEKLAESVAADIYLVLTDVEQVSVNFGKPDQRDLEQVTLPDARRYLAEGQFGRGSMAPKVLACIQFIEFGGEAAIIAGLASASKAVRGKAGTRFVQE